MASRPADASRKPKASNHGESKIRASHAVRHDERMQGGVAKAFGPNERRRSRGGLRLRDTAYAGAAC